MSSTVGEQPDAPAMDVDVPKRCSAMKISPPPSPSPSVDIDGVPLRDGQKIDLKHLLGHMPDIEDDEEEERTMGAGAGQDAASSAAHLIETQFQPVDDDDLVFGESDDDDEPNAEVGDNAPAEEPLPRKRRSSLKRCMVHAPADHPESSADHHTDPLESPGTDHSQKAVRFADAVGLGLADVRDLVNTDEPPTIPASALRDLHLRRRKRSKSHLTYSIDFSQPGSEPTFVTRVLTDKVALENCVACNDRGDWLTVSGVVRVANVAFDKQLTILYSVDGWTSAAHEVEASYLPGSNDGATDRFAFVLEPPPATTARPGARLEFALAYKSGGQTYWDNNAGANYGVDCSATTGPAPAVTETAAQ